MAGPESTQAKKTRPHGHDGFPLKDLSRPNLNVLVGQITVPFLLSHYTGVAAY